MVCLLELDSYILLLFVLVLKFFSFSSLYIKLSLRRSALCVHMHGWMVCVVKQVQLAIVFLLIYILQNLHIYYCHVWLFISSFVSYFVLLFYLFLHHLLLENLFSLILYFLTCGTWSSYNVDTFFIIYIFICNTIGLKILLFEVTDVDLFNLGRREYIILYNTR